MHVQHNKALLFATICYV